MAELIYIILGIVFVLFLVVVTTSSLENVKQKKISFFKTFLVEFIDDLKIILTAVFSPLKKLTKVETLKHLQQIGIYFLEIFTVSGIFLVIAQWLSPIDSTFNSFWFMQITRFLSFFTAYQIFVYSTLSLIQSAKTDSWSAVLRIIELTKLYLKTKNDEVKEDLNRKIEDALHPETFMTGKTRGIVEEISKGLENENNSEFLTKLDQLKINTENNIRSSNLFWRFSFLLHTIKPQGGAQ